MLDTLFLFVNLWQSPYELLVNSTPLLLMPLYLYSGWEVIRITIVSIIIEEKTVPLSTIISIISWYVWAWYEEDSVTFVSTDLQ